MGEVALIAAGAQALSAIAGGVAARNAAEFGRRQYEEEAAVARLAAVQDENMRRQDLARVLARQDAVRAGRGVNLHSGTGTALRRASIAEAEADIVTQRYNYLSRARRLGLAADQARASGTGALIGGFAGAAGSAFLGYSEYQKMKRDEAGTGGGG